MKVVTFGTEARTKLLEGVKIVSKTVGLSMGLKGLNVLLRGMFLDPQTNQRHPRFRYSKDGVSISRDIFNDDHHIDTGISSVRSACEATVEVAGDGTSATAVLCGALMVKGSELIDAGVVPYLLKKGTEQAGQLVIDEIKKIAVQVKDADGNINHKLAREVAMIASNSDKEIGGLVADAIEKVSSEGMITVEPSNDYKTTIETLEGVLLAGSIVSPYFITNNEKQTCELTNPYILLYDRTINLFTELKPIIGKILQEQTRIQTEIPILIVCQDCTNEAISFLVTNKMKGSLRVGVIKMSDFGVQKRKVLEDMAVATGAEFISEEKGGKLEKVTLKQLGRAEKVVIEKNDTIIITKKLTLLDEDGNKKDPNKYTADEKAYVVQQEKLKTYTDSLKAQVDNEQNPEDKKLAQTRYAHLTGSVAVIRVGGKTADEVSEKADRVDDALCASRSAIKEGIVPGGGSVYLKLSKLIDAMPYDNDDIRKGQLLVKEALEAPFRQLMSNAGIKVEASFGTSLLGGASIIEKVQNSEPNIGYNLANDKIEDLREAGIIDSAGVLVAALENSISASGLFFLLGATIVPAR